MGLLGLEEFVFGFGMVIAPLFRRHQQHLLRYFHHRCGSNLHVLSVAPAGGGREVLEEQGHGKAQQEDRFERLQRFDAQSQRQQQSRASAIRTSNSCDLRTASMFVLTVSVDTHVSECLNL